nr:MAG TPA_asm: protein of unknown function (DUF5505) [Caudoviricetes sp.]
MKFCHILKLTYHLGKPYPRGYQFILHYIF